MLLIAHEDVLVFAPERRPAQARTARAGR
jgi:hypothetical protein